MRVIDAVAIRVSRLLTERNMTQYALCKKIAIDPSNLYNIMYKRCNTITADKLFLLADGFDMTVQEFLDDPLFNKENLEID